MGEFQAGSRLIGRDRELDELHGALLEAGAGHGRIILLGGEPGIGKSRLVDELASRARSLGHDVLWGRAWEVAGAPPYWPWVQALRVYLRSTAIDDVRRDMGSGAVDVAQMLPELRDLFGDLPAPPDSSSDSARFQLFDSTATLLRNIARARALLVVLDDLHAADTPSTLLLRFLASQMGDTRMLVVATYRDVELTPAHPLTSAIAEIAREPVARVMKLTGLPAEAVGEYIRSTADVRPPDHVVAAVTRATNGNPLFIGEAVRLLSAEGRLTEAADLTSLHVAVPPGIRAVIARRVDHLSDGTAQALRLGAALGPEFSLEILRRVGEYGSDEVIDVLDHAVEAGLLLPVAGVRGRYRFSHDLVRETLYDELSPGRRARLHGRIAAVLEEAWVGSPEAHLTELAFHFGMAALTRDGGAESSDIDRIGPKAVAYARQAGDEAARSLAYEEGARLYRMALAVLDIEGLRDDAVRVETLLALGDVQARAGDLDGARAAFLDAAAMARRMGSGAQLARAALGVGGRLQWARPGNDARLIPLLQDALVMLGGSDERLRVRLLTRLACAWRSSPERRDDSAALSLQAVEIARGLGDPATLGDALHGRFWATWWPENPADRAAIAEEASVIAETLGDGEHRTNAHVMALMTLMERGRLTEAQVELATLSRLIDELRQPAHQWLDLTNRSLLALIAGEYDKAEEWIGRELDAGYRPTPGYDDVTAARSHRLLLRREQGRVAEEEATLRKSVEDYPWYPFHRAALACLLIDLGRDSEARALFEELARDRFSALYPDNEWLFGMSLASEACALLGDASAAAVLYEQLAPHAGRHAIGPAEGSLGALDRYLGLLAATLGRLDDGARHLTDAIEFNERMGARPWTAHCQHDLAVVLRRRNAAGDRWRAEELDRAARATAIQLGMALADRIGDSVEAGPAPATAGSRPQGGTFRREGEYWSIEFDGEWFRVRDSKGMRHLGRLLASPGHEVHALELARPESAGSDGADPVGGDLRSDALGDAGPVLDAEAKAAYRQRLADIRSDLAEADDWNDIERLARLKAEERALAHELAAAIGLGGRDRPAASASERARVSVTRAIRAALGRIAEQSRALGEHFDVTIRTGTFCAYVPDPHAPMAWRL